jgi:cell wall-associated NlpC family hydrolase
VKNNFSVINIYKKKNIKSEVVTQLLYGETFEILKQNKNWLKIKNHLDNYKGYILKKKFADCQKSTHKTYKLSTKLYSKPNKKFKIKTKLSFGSRIKILKKNGIFCKFDKFWIEKKNLKRINIKTKNPYVLAKKFIDVKYKWGGKHYNGLDCSALIQLCLNFNNHFCPRDTKDQIKYFKKKVTLKNIKKNDLIFWKGHVAIAISKKRLIHAYGPLKKTIEMPIKKNN